MDLEIDFLHSFFVVIIPYLTGSSTVPGYSGVAGANYFMRMNRTRGAG